MSVLGVVVNTLCTCSDRNGLAFLELKYVDLILFVKKVNCDS